MNKNNFCLSIIIKVLLAIIVSQGMSFASDKDGNIIKMAESGILTTLVTQSSENGRSLCAKNMIACVGPNKAEMGLAIISIKKENKFLSKFADLVRYQMDGDLSEEYTCLALENGDKLTKYYQRLKFTQLEKQCLSELDSLLKNKKYFGSVDYKQICRNKDSMKNKVRDLLSGISRKDKCDNEN